MAAKLLLHLPPNNEHDCAETGAHGVVHAVVQQYFTARTNGSELLQPPVAGADAGREDDEG